MILERGRLLLVKGRPLLILTACYLPILVWISPLYEASQNDDWAYFLTIQHWFDSGRLEHLGWNDPTLLFQVIWGGLFAKLFGLSYTSLRVSTLILSWLGVISLYGILRRIGSGRAMALLGSSTLLFNPLYLTLSYSFNTDVPYVALAIAAVWAFLSALQSASRARFLLAGGLMALAFLVRQQGLAIALLAPAFLWANAKWPIGEARQGWAAGGQRAAGGGRDGIAGRGAGTKRDAGRGLSWFRAALLVVAPVGLAVVVHQLWLAHATYGDWTMRISNLPAFVRTGQVGDLLHLLLEAPRVGAGMLLDTGVLILPLALAAWLASLQPLRRLPVAWLLPLAVVLLALASLWLMQDQPRPLRGWPYVGNYLTRTGPLGQGPPYLNRSVWQVLTWAALLPAAWLLSAAALLVGRRGASRGHREGTFVLLCGLAQFLPSLTLEAVYDRYLLVLVPPAAVAAACWARVGRRGLLAGFVGLALLAVVSLEWTRTYVDRSRAHWEVARELVARGVPEAEIRAGSEWDGAHLYLDALKTLEVRPPFHDNPFPWGPLQKPGYSLVERPAGQTQPIPGRRIVAARSYRLFLSKEIRTVAAITRSDRVTPPEVGSGESGTDR